MKRLFLACLLISLGGAFYAQNQPQWLWAQAAGGDQDDFGGGIAIDSAGNSYITGNFAGTAVFGSTVLTSLSDTGDIYVAKLDASGNWLWARRAGGIGFLYALGIATDSGGNCYITGSYYPVAEFGTTTLTSVGWLDIYVAKLDTNGNWLWAQSAGGPTNASYPTDLSYAIGTDAGGNCYISGSFYVSATFGSTSLNCFGDESNDDLFVAKLDSGGNWLWAVSAGGTAEDYAYGLYTDLAGTSYVAGSFCGNAAFGAINLVSSGFYDYEVFAAKLDSAGNWLWAVSAGGDNDDRASAIYADGSGNSYLTGSFLQNATFGTTSLSSSDFSWDDIFVAKLDSGGNWIWASQAGGYGDDDANGIAVDNSGNCYVSGGFTGAAFFGTAALVSNGFNDIFAAKLDAGGNWLWARQAGGQNPEEYFEYGVGLATDASGYSCVTGSFYGTAGFGAIQLTGFGAYDIFVAKLSPGDVPVNDELTPEATDISSLAEAYPNPFRQSGTTTIEVHIADRESGTLSLFNLRGQCLASYRLSSGDQQISVQGCDLPSGIYLYRLQTPKVSSVRKLILLR